MALKTTRFGNFLHKNTFDIFVMAALVVLNLPLLFTVPYQFWFDNSLYLLTGLNYSLGNGFSLPSGYPNIVHPILFSLIYSLFIKIAGGVALNVVWLVKIFAIPTTLVIYALGKRMFGNWAGAVSALLVTFMAIYRQNFNLGVIDTIKDLLLLLGLFFIWINYLRKGWIWLILAGIAMGLSFLQKEIVFVWFPVPWILFFADRRYRKNVNLSSLWIYTLTICTTIAAWMLWSYQWVGQMYPLGKGLTNFVIKFGPLLIIGAFGFSFLFVYVEKRFIWLKKLSNNNWWLRIVLLSLLGVIVLGSPLVTLFLHASARLSSPLIEIPAYVRQYRDFFPSFGIVSVAMALFAFLAIWKLKPPYVFGLLVTLLGFPLLSGIANANIPPRQVSGNMYIAYLLAVGLASDTLSWLQKRKLSVLWSKWKLPLPTPDLRALLSKSAVLTAIFRMFHGDSQRTSRSNYLGIVVAVCFLANFAWNQEIAYQVDQAKFRKIEEQPHAGWFNNQTIAPVASWVKENIPPGTPILASYWIHHALAYETQSLYPIFEIPMLQMQVSTSAQGPLFTPAGYLMPAYYPVPKEEVRPDQQLFIDYMHLSHNYYTLMEKDLFMWINDNHVEYLIIAGDYILKSMPYLDYFTNNSAFSLVMQGQFQPYIPVYIFKIDRTKLKPQGQYPLIISPSMLFRITEEVNGKRSFSNILDNFPRDISLRPITKNDGRAVYLLVDYYLQKGRFSPAFDLLKSLNEVSPGYIARKNLIESTNTLSHLEKCLGYLVKDMWEESEKICKEAAALDNSSGIPYFALGEIALARGNLADAIKHLERARDLNPDQQVFLRLGDAYRMSGLYDLAFEAYNQVLIMNPDNTVALMHKVEIQAILEQSQGNLDMAAFYYRSAIEILPNYWPMVEETEFLKLPQVSANYAIIDLLKGTELSSQQNIMIINREPKKVLLSPHADFRVTVPASGKLVFSMGLSPSVWQSGKGDGVQFEIFISDSDLREKVFSNYIDPKNDVQYRRWNDREIDLSPWSGHEITITLEIGPGPNNNSSFDWAGWGEPRIVLPIYYSLIDHYADSQTDSMNTEFGKSSINQQTINDDSRDVLFQHPSSRVTYTVDLPAQSSLYFGLGMAEEVWSADKGDGVVYSIYVRDPDKDYVLHRVFQKIIDPKNNLEDRQWFDEKVDLSRFGGKTVEIIFEAMPGPNNDYNFDWGGWSNPVIIDETLP